MDKIKNYFLKVVRDNYANFNGRARREEYWYFFLANMILSVVLSVVDGIIGMSILNPILSLALLVPSIAVAVRRVHDTGKSGWFILIPIYNLILMLTEGQPGSNEYGADPKGAGELEDHLVG